MKFYSVRFFRKKWIQCYSIQCYSIQFNAMQCNSMQFNAMQCYSIQCYSIQCYSIQFNAIQFNSIQFNAIQFNSIQFNSMLFNSRMDEGIYTNFPFSQQHTFLSCSLLFGRFDLCRTIFCKEAVSSRLDSLFSFFFCFDFFSIASKGIVGTIRRIFTSTIGVNGSMIRKTDHS
jgi:hypothetical protein